MAQLLGGILFLGIILLVILWIVFIILSLISKFLLSIRQNKFLKEVNILKNKGFDESFIGVNGNSAISINTKNYELAILTLLKNEVKIKLLNSNDIKGIELVQDGTILAEFFNSEELDEKLSEIINKFSREDHIQKSNITFLKITLVKEEESFFYLTFTVGIKKENPNYLKSMDLANKWFSIVSAIMKNSNQNK